MWLHFFDWREMNYDTLGTRVLHPLRFFKLEDTAGCHQRARQRADDTQQYPLGRLILC